MAEVKRKKYPCRNCRHSRLSRNEEGLCPACAERLARPDRGPDGRVLPPAVGKSCWGCGNKFATTNPQRTRCGRCERAGIIEGTRAACKGDGLSAALVAWQAVLAAKGLPCDSCPGGRLRWVEDWHRAFPSSGGAADDTARLCILATLDSAGRLDLLRPAPSRVH